MHNAVQFAIVSELANWNILATSMHKELVSTHRAAVRGGRPRLATTAGTKTRPAPVKTKKSSSNKIFPNVESRVCVDDNNCSVINTTATAQQYLVPISTRGLTKTQLANGKSRKATVLKTQAIKRKATEAQCGLIKPLPPDCIISAIKPTTLHSSELKRHSTTTCSKLSPTKRRDLAYLVVELNKTVAKERKKSFDDLDADLELRSSGREDQTSQLSRSSTISVPRRTPAATNKMPTGKNKLSPHSSHKSASQKHFLTSSYSEGSRRQSSLTSATESAGSAELSLNMSLSSTEVTNQSLTSTRLIKHKSLIEQQRRRPPPPPPPSSNTLLRPPTTHPTHIPSQPSQASSTSDSSPKAKPPVPRLESHLKRKRSSISQLKDGGLPFKPTAAQIAKNANAKPKRKLKESRSTSAPSVAQSRPKISNPQLISATKSVASTPVTGPFRNLPSPPPTPTERHLHTHKKYDVDSPYEEVDFSPSPVAPSLPVPPPRPKRDQRKQSKSALQKPNPSPIKPKSVVSLPSNSSLQKQLKSVQLHHPADYIEPVSSGGGDVCGETVSEVRESEEEDNGVGDYVDMESGVLSEWILDEEEDDAYVEMHLGPGAFDSDSPEPIYVEMNPSKFTKPPPQEGKSLYYATLDLFQNREDLQVNSSKKKKGQS